MTKLISVFIIAVVIFCGYQLFLKWEAVKNEEETKKKEAAAVMNPAHLPGMPVQLEHSYQQVSQQGTAALRNWLKTYDSVLQDPRKAWIELDLCVALTREDPSEARRIFEAVKGRTPPDSPLQPRIKQLEKTYE
jgi:hypothetical protein